MNDTMKCGICGNPIRADAECWELDDLFGAVHSDCWLDYVVEEFGYDSDYDGELEEDDDDYWIDE